MKVNQHMSARQLKEILNKRRYLNEREVKFLLNNLEDDLKSMTPAGTYEESFYTYHTNHAIFYPTVSSSGAYWGFTFLNEKFVLRVDMGRCFQNHITINFYDNTNKPTEQDQMEVVDQLFDIIENGEIFLLELEFRISN